MDMKLKVLTKVGASVKKALGPTGLKIKAASPDILIGVGVAGIIGGTVYACIQTTKLKDVIEEDKATRNNLKTSYDEIMTSDVDPEEAQKAYRKDLTHSYISTTGKVIKLYAGPVIVGTVSLSCVLYSHTILRKRMIGLAAAYTTVSESYKQYRQRVVDRYGKDVDRELVLGSTKMKLKDVDPDAVTEDNKKSKVDVLDEKNPQITSDICSDYIKFFDSSSRRYEPNPEYNLTYLKAAQGKFNDILHSQGYVFLNDILSFLDIPITADGQVVGWLDPNKYPEATGDGYIDFGIFDVYRVNNIRAVNGYENVFMLDFNVDGYIYNKVFPNNKIDSALAKLDK